jgi:hypothetical protein
MNDSERSSGASETVQCRDALGECVVSQSVAGRPVEKTYAFDRVFGPAASQAEVYDEAVRPVVDEVLRGFNCTIFAYGQTGTGKTYTMEGGDGFAASARNASPPESAGIVPRAVSQIFDHLRAEAQEFSVKFTFLELYNEEITDLLAEPSGGHLHNNPEAGNPTGGGPSSDETAAASSVSSSFAPASQGASRSAHHALMEDGRGGVSVRNLEEAEARTPGEIFARLARGVGRRRTAETLCNAHSSRSHSVFTLTVRAKTTSEEGEDLAVVGKLNLVDLAGSENVGRSGANKSEIRSREAGEINKSLLTLGRVIAALVKEGVHSAHVPYRDSKLTRLLRDALGGRSKTCVVATVSPSALCAEETGSTLEYALRAKRIRNRPEVCAKVTKTALVKDLQSQLERARGDLKAAWEKNGVYKSKASHEADEAERARMRESLAALEEEVRALGERVADETAAGDAAREALKEATEEARVAKTRAEEAENRAKKADETSEALRVELNASTLERLELAHLADAFEAAQGALAKRLEAASAALALETAALERWREEASRLRAADAKTRANRAEELTRIAEERLGAIADALERDRERAKEAEASRATDAASRATDAARRAAKEVETARRDQERARVERLRVETRKNREAAEAKVRALFEAFAKSAEAACDAAIEETETIEGGGGDRGMVEEEGAGGDDEGRDPIASAVARELRATFSRDDEGDAREDAKEETARLRADLATRGAMIRASKLSLDGLDPDGAYGDDDAKDSNAAGGSEEASDIAELLVDRDATLAAFRKRRREADPSDSADATEPKSPRSGEGSGGAGKEAEAEAEEAPEKGVGTEVEASAAATLRSAETVGVGAEAAAAVTRRGGARTRGGAKATGIPRAPLEAVENR